MPDIDSIPADDLWHEVLLSLQRSAEALTDKRMSPSERDAFLAGESERRGRLNERIAALAAEVRPLSSPPDTSEPDSLADYAEQLRRHHSRPRRKMSLALPGEDEEATNTRLMGSRIWRHLRREGGKSRLSTCYAHTTSSSDFSRPYFARGLALAEAMSWVRRYGNRLVLGPSAPTACTSRPEVGPYGISDIRSSKYGVQYP